MDLRKPLINKINIDEEEYTFFGGSSLLALNWAKIIYKKWNVTILLHKRKIEFPKVYTVH